MFFFSILFLVFFLTFTYHSFSLVFNFFFAQNHSIHIFHDIHAFERNTIQARHGISTPPEAEDSALYLMIMMIQIILLLFASVNAKMLIIILLFTLRLFF